MRNPFMVTDDDDVVRGKIVTPSLPAVASMAGILGILIGVAGSSIVRQLLSGPAALQPYELLGYLAIPFGAARFLFSWRRAVMVSNVAMCLLLAGYFGQMGNVLCWTIYSLAGGYMPVFWVTAASLAGMVGGIVLFLRRGREPEGPATSNWHRGPSVFEAAEEVA